MASEFPHSRPMAQAASRATSLPRTGADRSRKTAQAPAETKWWLGSWEIPKRIHVVSVEYDETDLLYIDLVGYYIVLLRSLYHCYCYSSVLIAS